MRCPRCGFDNPPAITACLRCGLPVTEPYPPQPAGSPQPGRPPPGQPPAGRHPPAPYGSGYGPPGYPSASGVAPASIGQHAGYAAAPPYTPTPSGSPAAAAPGSPPPLVADYPSARPLPRRGSTASSAPPPTATGWLSALLLAGAALLCLAYAIWALSARRDIFADFAANQTVSLDRARTSDRIDTALLFAAGGVAVVALLLWALRWVAGRIRAGVLGVLGLVCCLLGMACAVLGLVLSGLVTDAPTRVEEGQRAVTATVVTGSGFLAVAIGLLLGLLASRRGARTVDSAPPVAVTSG